MTKKLKKPKIGNPLARSPLLHKGGVHQRSRSGERQRDKRVLEKILKTCLDEDPDKKSPLQRAFFMALCLRKFAAHAQSLAL